MRGALPFNFPPANLVRGESHTNYLQTRFEEESTSKAPTANSKSERSPRSSWSITIGGWTLQPWDKPSRYFLTNPDNEGMEIGAGDLVGAFERIFREKF